MRVGLDCYTIGHLGLSAVETLEFAKEHRLAGVQFTDATQLSVDFRSEEIEAIRQQAEKLGLYLEIGVPSPNALRTPELASQSPADHAAYLQPYLEAAALAGCSASRTYIGWRDDRFRTDHPWPEQLEYTQAVFKELAPLLRDARLRLALETHADATSRELLRVIDAVGDDVAGICLDTGNLTMRLEEPLAAVQRLAPLVVVTHLKDSIVYLCDEGLCWQARPCGQGIVPLPEILRELARHNPNLNLSIEDHPRIYELRIFDRHWMASFAELPAAELGAVVGLAYRCGRRIASGELADPQKVEQ
ncbi:MAG: sugar phosphate isomerase/epimerase family protein, partial [Pirellulales bacterium]